MEQTERSQDARPPLSVERILAAAIALADKEGIEGLSMRRLARQFGVGVMTLYYYVANKDELLDGMVDIVYGEMMLPDRGADWRGAMQQRAISARDVLARHPWATTLMESRVTPGLANLRHHDAVLGCLREAGFSIELATHAYNVLDSYIFGFAVQAKTLPVGTPEELAVVGADIIQQMPADEYPYLREVGETLIASGFSYAEEFDFGLDVILDGLARCLAQES